MRLTPARSASDMILPVADAIGLDDFAGVGRPDAVIGGDMVEPVDAAQRGAQRDGVAQVADHDFGVEPFDIAARARSGAPAGRRARRARSGRGRPPRRRSRSRR